MNDGHNAITPQAQEVLCEFCDRRFIFRECDRVHLKKGMAVPNLCPICRKERIEKRKQNEELNNNEKRQLKKAADKKEFETIISNWNVIPIESIYPKKDHMLYILGNGFDLMHGVRSSYYDFRDSISKNNPLRYAIDNFITKDDAWADFEESLAHFDIQAMSNSLTVENMLDISGAYDKDAGAAEFYMAAENAADPISTVARDLQRRLRMWVETLTIGTCDKPLSGIFRNEKVLCFNYTEFVEELYGVSEDNVCYIHGCRRKKKYHPKESLILGHVSGASDKAFNFQDNWSPITRDKYKLALIDVAQEQVLNIMAHSDDALTKKCDEIFSAHRRFFDELTDIESVITIGHSFSQVDYDYFVEIVKLHPEIKEAKWYFGCHDLSDIKKLGDLLPILGLKQSNVFIFRTDTITVKFNDSTTVPIRCALSAKTLSVSENGKWSVEITGRILNVSNRNDHKINYEVVFPSDVYDAFFALSDKYLFVKIRGIDAGIILFHNADDSWHFVAELRSIPNQSLNNPRLKRVLLTEQEICFVYNSRVRKYSLSDGDLVLNAAVRNAPSQRYMGIDITDLITRRKVNRKL